MKVDFETCFKRNWMIRTNSIHIQNGGMNYGIRDFHNHQCGFNPYIRHNLHNGISIFI